MRSLTLVFVLLTSCLAQSVGQTGDNVSQHGGNVGIPLSAVLNITDIVEQGSWADRQGNTKIYKRGTYTADYYARRQAETCDFPLDIVILQDLTDSFTDNIEEMKNVQLHQMIDGLSTTHPGSRFALVSFQDKAVWPLGNRDDACWSFYSDFSSNLEPIYDAYASAQSYGGADAPENHFGAILAAMQTSKLSWSPLTSAYSRLIVVVTDAAPHHAEDGLNPDPSTLTPWSGKYTDDKADDLCLKTYYPSAQQVYDQIVERQTYIAALVFDGDWANGWAANGWKTFNKFLAQPDEMVEPDAENSAGFWDKLSKIIGALEDIECEDNTTTTTTTTAAATTTTTAAATTTTTATPTTTTLAAPATTTTTTSTAVIGPPVSVTPTLPTTTTTTTTTSTAIVGPPVSVTPTKPQECHPTVITDVPCIPTPENCYCQPEVVFSIRDKPENLKIVGDDKVIIDIGQIQ